MQELSEQAKQILTENLKKLPDAEKRAKANDASLKEILEYFFIKDIIAYIEHFGELPDFIPRTQNKIVAFSETEKNWGLSFTPNSKNGILYIIFRTFSVILYIILPFVLMEFFRQPIFMKILIQTSISALLAVMIYFH